MKLIFKYFVFFLVFYLGCLGISYADKAAPKDVYVGIYPTTIYGIDLVKGTFNINFYAWWRSSRNLTQPVKDIEIINGVKYDIKYGVKRQNKREYFNDARITAMIHTSWNIKYFPFDRQFLTVDMEEFSASNNVDFEPDYQESHLYPGLVIPGWKIMRFTMTKSIITYESNFGDSSITQSQFPRLSFTIELKRMGWRPYLNYFIGFFVTAFLCIIGFFVEEHRDSIRSALCIGSIFAFVGNKYLIDAALPMSSTFSLADAIQAATFMIIIISVLTFIFRNKLLQKFAMLNSHKFESVLGISLMCLYVLYIGINTIMAVLS